LLMWGWVWFSCCFAERLPLKPFFQKMGWHTVG